MSLASESQTLLIDAAATASTASASASGSATSGRKVARKQPNPKCAPNGYTRMDLAKRTPVKIIPAGKKLHFASAMTFLQSLQNEEFDVDFEDERMYGFYPPQFYTKDKERKEYIIISFNIYFHTIKQSSSIYTDTGGDSKTKTFGLFQPMEISPDHIDREHLEEMVKQEGDALLGLTTYLASRARSNFEGLEEHKDKSIAPFAPTTMDQMRVRLPPAMLKDKKFDLDKLQKMAMQDKNTSLSLTLLGAWALVPNAEKENNRMLAGVSFKLMPWLHNWYYIPPALPKQAANKRKRSNAITDGNGKEKEEDIDAAEGGAAIKEE